MQMENLSLRAETPEDAIAVHEVNLAAFGRSNEADLVDRLREISSTLSFVALASEQVVGHICFSVVETVDECADDLLLMGLAPVAVLPQVQRQGIGSSLIRYGLAACARSGCKAVVVLGNPAYYSRFGFIPARERGLQCEYTVPDEAFMVLELEKDALGNCRGTVKYRPEFKDCE